MEWSRGASTRREFEEFVARQTPSLLRSCYLITWNLVEAEDLVQEVWLSTAQRWPQIRTMEYPAAYVRRSLINRALRHGSDPSVQGAKSTNRETIEFDEHEDARHEQNLSLIDTRSEITWLLGTLTRNQRAVIVLRYFEDLSEQEIADQLGWPIGTVKSTASRAIDRLQRAHTEDSVLQNPATTHQART
jgi:RNA polymerase sigma-70 factor (sigma-E family)